VKEAIDVYSSAILLDTDFAELYMNRGVALRDDGQLDESLRDLEVAICKNPNYAAAYFNRAITLASLGRLRESVESYEHAIAIDPNQPLININKAIVHIERGEYKDSLLSMEQALKVNPSILEGYVTRARALRNMGECEVALNELQKLIKKAPNNIVLSDAIVHTLNFDCIKSGDNGQYAMAQNAIQDVWSNLDSVELIDISDQDIKSLFDQSEKIIDKFNINPNTNYTQLHRGESSRRDCIRHQQVFNSFNVIPGFCFDCYKVTCSMSAVIDLVRVLLLFSRIQLPNDNSRKCMVEMRPDVGGAYKCFIYCIGLIEAEDVKERLIKAQIKNINSEILISIKRVCTEFAMEYPLYGDINFQGKQPFKCNSGWKQYEDTIDERRKEKVDAHMSSRNHKGMTLLDLLVMKKWISVLSSCIILA